MKRQVAGSRWHRVGLLILVCLFLNMDSSTAQLTREQLLDMCDNQNRQEALAGPATPPVILMCNTTGGPVLGGVTWTLQRIGEDDVVSLDTSLPKYDRDAFLTFNQLLIRDIAVADDGLYGCSFTHFVDDQPSPQNRSGGCIYVFGTAKFASCEDTSPCSENVPTVTRSGSIVLNVSVDFFRQGASGHNQRVTLLNLYNSTDSFRQFPKYTCRNEGSSPCTDSGRVVVEQGGSHKFDIVLRITNSTPEDSGNYTAIVEVKNPHTFGQAELFKTFMVTVTEVDCGNLTDPENGRVTLTDTILGSTATYSCNPGYIRVGVEARTCLINGEWSHELPVCTLVVCGNLTDPENGRVTLTDTTLDSTAIYSCNPGYTRVGVESRTCLTNGEWSDEPPVCTLDCGNLTDPQNGQVTLIDTTLGFTATYSCNPGYTQVGVETRTCQINGEWSEEPPVCTLLTVVVCGNLTDPENGQVILTDTTEGSTANYSCNSGYTRVGVETRTCQINGEWSDEPPVCTRPGTDDNNTLIIATAIPFAGIIMGMFIAGIIIAACVYIVISGGRRKKTKALLCCTDSQQRIVTDQTPEVEIETTLERAQRLKDEATEERSVEKAEQALHLYQQAIREAGFGAQRRTVILEQGDCYRLKQKLEKEKNTEADLRERNRTEGETGAVTAPTAADTAHHGRTKAAEGQPPPGGTDETDYLPQVERSAPDSTDQTQAELVILDRSTLGKRKCSVIDTHVYV